jgi:hypothetical protein
VDEFLIAMGAPFYDLQQRLGLLHERALNAGRRTTASRPALEATFPPPLVKCN